MQLNPLIKKNKTKVIAAAAFVIAALLVLVYFLTKPNEEELIKDFEQAIMNEDTAALKKIVNTEKDVHMSKDNLKQLVSYSKEEPQYLIESMQILKAQAAIMEDDLEAKRVNPIFQPGTTEAEILLAGDFYLRKKEGLLASYQIYARTYTLNVSTDQNDAVVKVNGKKVLDSKSGSQETTLHNLAPGNYIVSGEKRYEFTEVNSEKELALFGDPDFLAEVDLDLAGKKVEIQSDLEDATVFANGKSTGQKISKDQKKNLFGPFASDGTTKLHGEFELPWGVIKSEPLTLEENTEKIEMKFQPFSDESTKKELIESINTFAKQEMEALIKQDPSLVTAASHNMITDLTKDIQFDVKQKHYWKGEALGTRINTADPALINKEGEYAISVPVEFHYKRNEYIKGFNEDKPLEESYNRFSVFLTYDASSKEWLVSAMYPTIRDAFESKSVVETAF
ncbi:TcaA 3rd/4th domain-containing protein [Bacillus infantis]|uniref:TcaA 3rd/4th domain-containing protein n=1 Tax=Bacillus infantis TaxID=324767 RepID=UPI003CED2274